MKHLDLFSGIGGFALAVESTWPEVEHIFCEIDPFCQQVLKKHFPNSPIHVDIKTFKANDLGGIDLLTGGFPCQPFSQAGKQRGKEDDRYLWPEMLRVIRESKPTWIIGENVAGIVNLALEQVCIDLEAEGYEVQPLIIPACAVNAPHRRDRVWIIAYCKRFDGEWGEQVRDSAGQPQKVDRNGNRPTSNAHNRRSAQQEQQATGDKQRRGWNESWIKVATEFCSVDDGLPVELDGLKLTKAQHRTQRLKAYGNAIVPQVAAEIFKAMKPFTN